MRIKSIKLSGFIGIKKGLGVDSVDLDLAGLRGLIALEGDNGMGKTTLLENLQPFRTLPSRKSTLKKQCFLKNSQKELTFNFNGDTFKTLVKMDPTTTVGDEGFIWKNGDPVVDGKVRNFDKYLAELLGSQNLFFNSIFCAQNSSKLSDMRPAELKALFAEFLRLDRYVAWETTSKAAARIHAQAIDALANEYDRLDITMKMLGDPRADLAAGNLVTIALENELAAMNSNIDHKKKGAASLKELALNSRVLKERAAAITKEIDRLKAEGNYEHESYIKRQNEFSAQGEKVKAEALEVKMIIKDKAEIEAAARAVKEADKAIADIESEVEVLEIEAADLRGLVKNEQDRAVECKGQAEKMAREGAAELDSKMAKINILKEKIAQVVKALEDIDKHPQLVLLKSKIEAQVKSGEIFKQIDPACASETCGLIVQNIADLKELPITREKYNKVESELIYEYNTEKSNHLATIEVLEYAMEVKIGQDKAQMAQYDKRLAEITDAIGVLEKNLGAIEAKVADLREKRLKNIQAKVKYRPIAELAPGIIIAESRLKDLEAQLEEIKKQSDSLEKNHTTQVKQTNETLMAKSEEIADIEKEIDPEADAKLEAIEAALEQLIKDKADLASRAAKNLAVIDKAKNEIVQLIKMETDLSEIEFKKKSHSNQYARWNYLQNACSKDGLRALEIEGVAPLITEYANDMLTGTFGPNHSVRFETLDEDGREVLDIIVINGDGSEAMLSNLSGGERVWVLKALRLAQTLISQEKSGRHFQTALMDEEDGALSNKNAIRFIKLYSTMMKIAKMDSCFYISHRPDAISMADHRIKFNGGGLKII